MSMSPGLVVVADTLEAESDRQMTILAYACLATERPGWEHVLGILADKLGGRELFDQFLALHRDTDGSVHESTQHDSHNDNADA